MRTFYIYTINEKSEIISYTYGVKAKSRFDAIKHSNVAKIYWQGNRPYGVDYIGSKFKVYAKLQV